MARQHTPFSPVVPLGNTWDEILVIQDGEGGPVDLTGWHVRAQLYLGNPARNGQTGAPVVAPALEITTPDYYVTAPTWPVVEGFDVPAPETGIVYLTVPPQALWQLSPTNTKGKYLWEIQITNPATGVVRPAFIGAVSVTPARTL